MYWLALFLALMILTEPTGNVAPRIAGERYEGGKLVDVPMTSTAALDCATQGFPVPFTRYIIMKSVKKSSLRHGSFSEGTSKIAPRSSGKKFEGWEVALASRGQDIALSHSLQGYPIPVTR